MEEIIDNKKMKLVPKLSDIQYNNFWTKVNLTSDDKMCWEWLAAIDVSGYGTFAIQHNRKRESHKAHRVSFFLKYGQIKKGYLICHSCDNRKCVNPDHLFEGTTRDNCLDMISKGRDKHDTGDSHWSRKNPAKVRRGEDNNKSKLKTETVLNIRLKGNQMLQDANFRKLVIYNLLSIEFFISETVIRRILKRQIWKHV